MLTEVVVSLKTKVANASRVPIEDFRNEARRLKARLSTVQKLRAEADSDLRKEEHDSLSKERSLMGARPLVDVEGSGPPPGVRCQ